MQSMLFIEPFVDSFAVRLIMRERVLLTFVGLLIVFMSNSFSHAVENDKTAGHKHNKLDTRPAMEVVSGLEEYKKGEKIPAHFHHGVETIYVIQGSTVKTETGETRQIPSGAQIVNLRNVMHAGYTVMGETSFKFYAVRIVDKGKPLFDSAKK
jgi:quercetin dioxygenase-like cupin family protein